MINGCTDRNSARFEDDLRIYAAFARRNGAPAEVVEGAVRMQRESLFSVPPEREEALLAEAHLIDRFLALVDHGRKADKTVNCPLVASIGHLHSGLAQPLGVRRAFILERIEFGGNYHCRRQAPEVRRVGQ